MIYLIINFIFYFYKRKVNILTIKKFSLFFVLTTSIYAEFNDENIVYQVNDYTTNINNLGASFEIKNQHFIKDFSGHDVNNSILKDSKFSNNIEYLGNTNTIQNVLFEHKIKEFENSGLLQNTKILDVDTLNLQIGKIRDSEITINTAFFNFSQEKIEGGNIIIGKNLLHFYNDTDIENLTSNKDLDSSKIEFFGGVNSKGIITNFTNNGTITGVDGKLDKITNLRNTKRIVNSRLENTFVFNSGEAINSQFSIQGDFENTSSGKISGKENSSVLLIKGDSNISNHGSIEAKDNGAHLKIEKGKVRIENWKIDLEGISGVEFDSKKDINKHIVVDGGNSTNIAFENESIFIKNPKINEKYNINNILLDANKNSIAGVVSVDKIKIDGSAQNDIFEVIVPVVPQNPQEPQNPDISKSENESSQNNDFIISVNAAKSASTILAKNHLNNNIARSSFVGNVINSAINSMENNIGNVDFGAYNQNFSSNKIAQISSDVLDVAYLPLLENTKKTHLFATPYFVDTSIDITKDKLKGSTYGFISGVQHNLGENKGIAGIFLGVEEMKSDTKSLEQKDLTFYGGIDYYKEVYAFKNANKLFIKAMAKGTYTNTDLTKLSENKKGDVKMHAKSAGAEVGLGAKVFVSDEDVLTPYVSVSYDRIEMQGFKDPLIDNVFYGENAINATFVKTNLAWNKKWNEYYDSEISLGLRFNLDDEFITNAYVDNERFSATSKLSRTYYYFNTALIYHFNLSFGIAAIYNAEFSRDSQSHSGFLRMSYAW